MGSDNRILQRYSTVLVYYTMTPFNIESKPITIGWSNFWRCILKIHLFKNFHDDSFVFQNIHSIDLLSCINVSWIYRSWKVIVRKVPSKRISIHSRIFCQWVWFQCKEGRAKSPWRLRFLQSPICPGLVNRQLKDRLKSAVCKT